MLNNLGDKANGREQPTTFTFPPMTKSIYTQSVRTVKARIEPRQLGICTTCKTIVQEMIPLNINIRSASNFTGVGIYNVMRVINWIDKRSRI